MAVVQRAILRELRFGPLTMFEISEGIDEPLFRVRAELKCLQRDRLVVERIGRDERVWAATDRGMEIAWSESQTGLFG